MKPRTTDEQILICKNEWFKDHKAAIIGIQGNPPYRPGIIEWKKPTSWNYGCHFIIHSQWLCVVGDLGEATYQWGESIDLKFLGSLNFDYFHGKCRASPVGRQFRMWDQRTMMAAIKQVKDTNTTLTDKEKEFLNEINPSTCKDEFEELLRAAHYNGDVDTDFCCMVSECGYIPDCMAVGHFTGLQMAIKQLTEQEQPPTPP